MIRFSNMLFRHGVYFDMMQILKMKPGTDYSHADFMMVPS